MTLDTDLLRAWRGGDAAAGGALFERNFDALYRFFRNKIGDGIDDAVQETFLACLSGPEFRGESSFRTYLFAIARNVLHAQMKRLGRARAEVDVGEISVMDLGPSPSTLAARRREERLLLAALRAIPLDMQIALELFYWEDLSGSELAVALGIPEGTVRSRLRRAREALDQKLAELSESPSLLASTASDLEVWAKGLRDQVHPDPPRQAG